MPLSLSAAGFFGMLAQEVHEKRVGPFDSAVMAAVAQRHGELDGPMLWLTRIGQGESMLAIGLCFGILLMAMGRRHETAFLAVVGAGALGLNAGLKLAFHRPRPGVDALYLIQSPGSFSFPSGHALGSTTLLFALVVIARATGVRGPYLILLALLAAALVVGIATSRVYLGAHFPSDVLGGALSGAAWVSAVTGWFYPRVLPGEQVPPPVATD